ncbi:MAG: hypothetical protein WCP92_08525 [bacterium]
MKPIEIIIFVVFIIAMFFYLRHLLVTDFTPHPIAFGIWFVADLINFLTYIDFSKFWIAPAIMPLGAAIIVVIGIIKRKKNHREKFKRNDLICIVLVIISLLIWALTRNAIWSNMIIQIIIALGFVPIIDNILHEKPEPLFPWFLFIIGWTITCIYTFIGYESVVELIYPFVNGLFGCIVIFIGSWIVIRRRIT